MSPKKKINQRSSDEEPRRKDMPPKGVTGRNKHTGKSGTRDRKRGETRLVLVPSATVAPNDGLLRSVIDEWLVPCLLKQFIAERNYGEPSFGDDPGKVSQTNPGGPSNK
jgi:hypothetical protein